MPSNLRYKIGVAQTSIWAMPNGGMKTQCQDYLDKVEQDVMDNLNQAYNFINSLVSSNAALENGVSKADAEQIVNALESAAQVATTKWQNAISEQKAQYATFADKNTDHQLDFLEKVLNPALWDSTPDNIQYGGTAFWQAVEKGTTDALSTMVNSWPATGTSKGSQYYSFKGNLWKLLAEMFHDAMTVTYVSVPGSS